MSSNHDNPNGVSAGDQDELLSAYVDGELSDVERAAVERRLAEDVAAQQTIDAFRAVSQELRDLPAASLSTGFAKTVLRQVEQHQANITEDQVVAPREGKSHEQFGTSLQFGRSRRAWFWASTAVAAALLLMVFSPQEAEIAKEVALAKPQADGSEVRVSDGPAAATRSRATDLTLGDHFEMSAVEEPLVLSNGLDRIEEEAAKMDPASGSGVGGSATTDALRMQPLAGSSFARPRTPVRSEVAVADDELEVPLQRALDSPQLFVRVQLRTEAFNNSFVDEVLTTNGIAIQGAEETERSRRSRLSGRAAEQSRSHRRADLRREGEATPDVLFVDAPAPQVAACLNELKNDYLNCGLVYVCPSETLQQQAVQQRPSFQGSAAQQVEDSSADGVAPESLASGRATAGNLATGGNTLAWQSYNRTSPQTETRFFFGGQLRQVPKKNLPTARAFRLAEPLRQQVADETRANAFSDAGVGNAFSFGQIVTSRRLGRSSASLPAPTDNNSQVQALLIVEASADVPDASGEADTTPPSAPPTSTSEPAGADR